MTYHLCVLVGKPIPRVLVGKGPERIVCVLKLQEGTAVLGWNAAERRGGGVITLCYSSVSWKIVEKTLRIGGPQTLGDPSTFSEGDWKLFM